MSPRPVSFFCAYPPLWLSFLHSISSCLSHLSFSPSTFPWIRVIISDLYHHSIIFHANECFRLLTSTQIYWYCCIEWIQKIKIILFLVFSFYILFFFYFVPLISCVMGVSMRNGHWRNVLRTIYRFLPLCLIGRVW